MDQDLQLPGAVSAESTATAETAPSAPAEPAATARYLLSLDDGVPLRECGLVLLGFAVIGALLYLPRIRHGGFAFDDWANAAQSLYPPGGAGLTHALSFFDKITGYRPVLVLYTPLSFRLSGTHAWLQLSWAAGFAVLIAELLYVVLRYLRLPRIHAWLIAALTLTYPWYDSTRLWIAADQASLAISLYLVGLVLALIGLRRGSRWLHLPALVLYVLSILSYEVAIPVILASGALYVVRFGWRAARLFWLTDLVAGLASGVYVGSHEVHQKLGLSAEVRHAGQIVTSGGSLLGRSVTALGETPHTAIALVLLGVVLLAGGVALAAGHARFGNLPLSIGLRSWMALAAAGFVVIVLGWLMFIPANPYYTPVIWGVTNRVNAVAGFGIVVLLYSACGIVGSLLGSRMPHTVIVAPLLTAALALVLGATYVRVLERHERIWDAAYRLEHQGLTRITTRFPRPANGTTLFVTGYPANETLGVPIFTVNYDLDGAVQLAYRTNRVGALPVVQGQALSCQADGVALLGSADESRDQASATTAYDHAILYDLGNGQVERPVDRVACRKVVHEFVPGPLYLSGGY